MRRVECSIRDYKDLKLPVDLGNEADELVMVYPVPQDDSGSFRKLFIGPDGVCERSTSK